MILGQFKWHGATIEVDSLTSELVGEVVWLNRIDGTWTPLAVIHNGFLEPTVYTPDNKAASLFGAYRTFRTRVPEAVG